MSILSKFLGKSESLEDLLRAAYNELEKAQRRHQGTREGTLLSAAVQAVDQCIRHGTKSALPEIMRQNVRSAIDALPEHYQHGPVMRLRNRAEVK